MNRVQKACVGQWIAVLRRPLLYNGLLAKPAGDCFISFFFLQMKPKMIIIK